MLLLLLCLTLAAGPAAPAQQSGGSLEELLEKARSERDREHERLAPRVAELAAKLEAARFAEEIERLQAMIDELGPEAAPLLFPYLDPGPDASEARLRRSSEIARALARQSSPAILDRLFELARTGEKTAQQRALWVIGFSKETERANAFLRGLLPALAGASRAECVRSLARLGQNDDLIVAALGDPDVTVVRAALDALAEAKNPAGAPAVLELLGAPSRADTVLLGVVGYYRALPDLLDEATVDGLLACVLSEQVDPERRIAALDALPGLGVTLNQKQRKAIEPLLDSPNTGLRESALIALTLLKDGKARRELLRFYDELVEENDKWPQAYRRRGDVYARIEDYPSAIKDYKTAIELLGNGARLVGNRDLWVALAKAYVKDGKLRPAAETIEEFGLDSELKRQLKEDPDFAPLREQARYKKLFE